MHADVSIICRACYFICAGDDQRCRAWRQSWRALCCWWHRFPLASHSFPTSRGQRWHSWHSKLARRQHRKSTAPRTCSRSSRSCEACAICRREPAEMNTVQFLKLMLLLNQALVHFAAGSHNMLRTLRRAERCCLLNPIKHQSCDLLANNLHEAPDIDHHIV